ncbi:TPA: Na+/H+ antiporter NhaC family protein [Staphylococcus aureus]|nr:Na+/H+ antiporter NhaC family protein [Staphylococcus aureus]
MMTRKPTFLESISTMIVMVIVVVTGFVFFDIPIQVLLIIASAYATWIAKRVGLTWQDLEKGIAERLNTAMPAILIILAVGIIVGSWMFSGTVPAMLISSFSAIIVGTFNHHFKMTDGFKATFSGFNDSMIHQSHISSSVKSLLEQGGMMSMTQILVTIFCGYAFAGIVEKAGCLEVLLTTISKGIHSVGSLICVTVICCIALVFAAGVASIVIIMVGVLMKDLFEKYQVSRSVLSRTLEDSSTMVLPLIPWGTSGIYYTNQLHVSVGEFFIWTVPCYLCAIIAIIYGFTGIGIKKSSNSRLT